MLHSVPRTLLMVALVLVAAGAAWSPVLGRADAMRPDPPAGVSEEAVEGTVDRVEDGDTIVARFNGKRYTVDLIAVDAPEMPATGDAGECFAEKSQRRLASLVDDARRVWVERDTRNRALGGHVLRYVWLEDRDGKATLLNAVLIRHGYAALAEDASNVRHLDALRAAQDAAWASGKGMWAACGGPHVALPDPVPTPVPVATSCGAFRSFDAAQTYYASRPDAQPYLDPNYDGRACEDWFGVDVVPTPVPPYIPPAGGGDTSSGTGGGGRTGYGGNDGIDYDCRDFATQAAAQAYFNGDGGSAYNNVDALDHNNNGVACDEYGLP